LGAWEESIGGVAGEKGTAEEKSDDDEGLDEGSGAHSWDAMIRYGIGCDEYEGIVIVR